MPGVKITGIAELLYNADAHTVKLGIRGEKSGLFDSVQLVDYNYSGVTVMAEGKQIILASSEIVFVAVLETNQEHWKNNPLGGPTLDSLI